MVNLKELEVEISGKTIVQNINIDINKGEFLGIIGPNGSGKSTILKTISKTLKKKNGEIKIEEIHLEKYKSKEYSQFVSTLTQHNKTVEGISVWDMVSYGRIPHKSLFGTLEKHDNLIINQALKETDIFHLKDRYLHQLSGGELQRVHLASSFTQEPDLLILDEPTNHLDIKHQLNTLSIVKNRVINDKLTVLCVLHDINQAIKFADKIAMIKDGKLMFIGKPLDVINIKNIKDVFDVNVQIHNNSLVEFLL